MREKTPQRKTAASHDKVNTKLIIVYCSCFSRVKYTFKINIRKDTCSSLIALLPVEGLSELIIILHVRQRIKISIFAEL